MADFGQVTPFNASVPHLSNGGNNTDLPHGGVVRHCKSKLIEYLRVLGGGCLEPKPRPGIGLSPHWAVPRLELLSDLSTACPPPLIEAASSDVDSVFVNVGVLIVQTYLGCFGERHLVFSVSHPQREAILDPRALDWGTMRQRCYCLFLSAGWELRSHPPWAWSRLRLFQEESRHSGFDLYHCLSLRKLTPGELGHCTPWYLCSRLQLPIGATWFNKRNHFLQLPPKSHIGKWFF